MNKEFNVTEAQVVQTTMLWMFMAAMLLAALT